MMSYLIKYLNTTITIFHRRPRHDSQRGDSGPATRRFPTGSTGEQALRVYGGCVADGLRSEQVGHREHPRVLSTGGASGTLVRK